MMGAPLWSPSFSGGEPVVSYSQNAEDVRLWRVFRTVENGFYVDVGAADPYVDSVTQLFYEHGWSGINVEPSPCFQALNEARNRDVNLWIAIGESEGSVPFFLTYPYLGLSTFDLSAHEHVPEAIERIEEITVPQRRLESVLREHAAGRTIHFLKVDAEGAEAQVLASSDWSVFRPIIVVVEAIESWATRPTHQNWEKILLDAGYRFATFDGINRFYVDGNHEHLIPVIAYPVSALDRLVPAPVRDLEARSNEMLASLEEKTTECENLRQLLDDSSQSRTRQARRRIATAASRARVAGGRLRELWFG